MATGIPHGTIAGAGGPHRPDDTPGLFRLAVELVMGGIMAGALSAALIIVPVWLAAGGR
jgi:hypothetical protein